MKTFLALFASLVLALGAQALDIFAGKTLYRDCTQVPVEVAELRFIHADGTARVHYNLLSPALQVQYFGTEKIAAFQKADIATAEQKRLADERTAKEREASAITVEKRRAEEVTARAAEDVRQLAEKEKRRVEQVDRERAAANAETWREIRAWTLWLILLAVCLIIYFIPTIIAVNRKKTNAGAIFALNLFLGWALVGWVVALVWALSVDAVALLIAKDQAEARRHREAMQHQTRLAAATLAAQQQMLEPRAAAPVPKVIKGPPPRP